MLTTVPPRLHGENELENEDKWLCRPDHLFYLNSTTKKPLASKEEQIKQT